MKKQTQLLVLFLAVFPAWFNTGFAAENLPIRSMGCPTEFFLIQDLASAYKQKTGQTVLAGAKNSSSGMLFLSKGKIDFAFSCRPPDLMQDKLKIDPAILERWEVIPLAVEPIVFVAHTGLAVDSLSLAQIRSIFFGTLSNWQEVGGPDLPIKSVSYGADEVSGMELILREVVLCHTFENWLTMPFSANTKIRISEPNLLGYYVNRNPGSIGYFGFAHLQRGYRQNMGKVLRVNGVEPTLKNIVNGSYPFAARYRLIYDKSRLDAKLERFIKFVKSDEGKEVINEKFIAVDSFNEPEK